MRVSKFKLAENYFAKRVAAWKTYHPPQDALLQHVKVVYQVGIWISSHQVEPEIPTPSQWGWEDLDGQWKPLWMTLSEAANACTELIHCVCLKKCKNCKYMKTELPCTEFCRCICQK